MSSPGSASAAGGNSNNSKEHNTVHQDAIWRQLIKYELDWARSWERKWGFMKTSFNENTKEPQKIEESASPSASGLPTLSKSLVEDKTYNFDQPVNVPDHVLYPKKRKPGRHHPDSEKQDVAIPRFGKEELKSYYLLTHQTRKLQLEGGMPNDKYSFPPTRSNEIGWWVSSAAGELKKKPESRNTLVDAKLGRWARGQGDVYAWWGGGPK